LKKALQGKLLQECFGTLLNPKKSLVNDFEHKFNLSCEIAGQNPPPIFLATDLHGLSQTKRVFF
jgi:hypothetical protein